MTDEAPPDIYSFDPDQYDRLANKIANAIATLLNDNTSDLARHLGKRLIDAMPMVDGAVTGAALFALENGVSSADLAAHFHLLIDVMIPQIEFSIKADAASTGPVEGGKA